MLPEKFFDGGEMAVRQIFEALAAMCNGFIGGRKFFGEGNKVAIVLT